MNFPSFIGTALLGGSAAAFYGSADPVGYGLMVGSLIFFEYAISAKTTKNTDSDGEIAVERDGDDVYFGITFSTPTKDLIEKDEIVLKKVERNLSKEKSMIDVMSEEE